MPINCPICKKPIAKGKPTASFVGGFFDPGEEEVKPEYFVEDKDVLQESFTHLDCLLEKLLAKGTGNMA